jgi:hypothetical protein
MPINAFTRTEISSKPLLALRCGNFGRYLGIDTVRRVRLSQDISGTLTHFVCAGEEHVGALVL